MNRQLSIVLTGVLGATACSDSTKNPRTVQSAVTLTAFNSCTDLEGYIEDTAVAAMRASLEQTLRNDSPDFRFAEPAIAPETGAAADAAAPTGPTDYTGTNNQVSGVDEADFVKTNGTHIFTLSGRRLHITKSWPANEMASVASYEIEGHPQSMFLAEGDRIVVFSEVYEEYEPTGSGQPEPGAPDCIDCFYGYGRSFVKATVLDASDLSNITTSREIYLPGSNRGARLVGNAVRLVIQDSIEQPRNLAYWPEGYTRANPMFGAAIRAIMDENEALIRARTLDEWLPSGRHRLTSGTEVTIARDCGDYHRSNAPVELGLANVVTIDLGEDASFDQTIVMGHVQEIYASTTSLYIASPHWWWWPAPGQESHTYLHKFNTEDGAEARYVASGTVRGTILNQFSMDEFQGNLRMALTSRSWEEDPNSPWGRMQSSNYIAVVAERDGQLETIGATDDLAENESITSARFIGDKGFAVTFERIDPFFTFDLSDPENPRVVGELKIPGFSSYLHPLDENHLLAIGTYIPDPGEGQPVDWSERSMKISVFDISNFADPQLKFETLVGTAHGWSDAAWEHKAFNYFPAKQTLAIPFADWGTENADDYWGSFTSSLKLFRIDTTTGIESRGEILISDIYQSSGRWGWDYYYSPFVRRSVMADDYAYAISDAGIRAAHMDDPSTPLATVRFEENPEQ